MTFRVVFQLLHVFKGCSAHFARIGLVLGVGPSDVTVVSSVRGEGLPAVLTLERSLSGVLANVCAQNTGSRECLVRRGK